MTSMWIYQPGYFAYQTDSESIAANLKRRQHAKLLNRGVNCVHFVYLLPKKNIRDAISTLKSLTGKKPIYDKLNEVWNALS